MIIKNAKFNAQEFALIVGFNFLRIWEFDIISSFVIRVSDFIIIWVNWKLGIGYFYV